MFSALASARINSTPYLNSLHPACILCHCVLLFNEVSSEQSISCGTLADWLERSTFNAESTSSSIVEDSYCLRTSSKSLAHTKYCVKFIRNAWRQREELQRGERGRCRLTKTQTINGAACLMAMAALKTLDFKTLNLLIKTLERH